MQNKNVLIIGGSSGIGLAICQQCDGNTVYNISRTACPTASVKSFCADVTDYAALKRAFDKIPDIDVMFYCAGTSLAAPVADAERNDYKNLFDVNLVGAVDCCKLALGKMRHSGKIVLLSSVGAVVPIAYDSFYSASKAGLCMFARALDLENKNIDCTAAIIGGVRTQFSFKRKIYEGSQELKRAANRLIRIEQTGYTAPEIAKELIKPAERKTPPVVTVGAKTKLSTFIYSLLPQCLKQFAEKRVFGLTNKG